MANKKTVRWMVNFWHTRGDRTTEPDFPPVDFWHPTKRASRKAAANVLWHLWESGDKRDWVAAGHPDPLTRAADAWYNPGPSWTLTYFDLESDGKGGCKIRSAAGFGVGNPYWENLDKERKERRARIEAELASELSE